ncbi:hypothetical protein J7J45_07315 [Candidatus Aerophobetes bacterium]|nr:hypothetical protein [Candidatus Aerophobetes bacterium]
MRKIKAFVYICVVLCIASMATFSVTVSAKKYQDSEYLEWSAEVDKKLLYYGEKQVDALEDNDWVSIKIYADAEYDFLSDVLDEIDSFEVTPGTPLSESKKERKSALEDKKWAAYYLMKAADSYFSGDLEDCADYMEMCKPYMESATRHMKKAREVLEKGIGSSPTPTLEVTPSPTSQAEKDSDGDGVPDEYDYAPYDPNVQTKEDIKTPGFGTAFAIGSLLAVAYLVLRRKCQKRK